MQIGIDIYFTLALSAAALVTGRALVQRIAFLSAYSIPDAVVGGMLFAAILAALRAGAGLTVEFDPALLTPLNVAFFTSVGLSADARSLAKGGRTLALFFLAVAGAIVLQNAIGVSLARVFDIHPATGLIVGSITLSGGHGTGAAWAARFVEERNLQGAVELAIASATYGLVAGGLLGGPFADWLLRRFRLRASAGLEPPGEGAVGAQPLSLPRAIETLLLLFASMAAGLALYGWLGTMVTLPSFIWALLVGVALRNVLSLTGWYGVDARALDTFGALALSLFLSMIIMTIKLWELADLAGPVLAILLVQTVATVLYAGLVTFPLTGRNYDSALIATGHLGFALGTTATAMVNVQSVAARHGGSRLAFLVVPVMGAFLTDIANAVAIQGFLALPLFNW